MNDVTTETNPEIVQDKVEEAVQKEPKVKRTVVRMHPESVIQIGMHKDNQLEWGTVPFREGTRRHNYFSKLTPGMTVQEALDSGVDRGFLNWYRKAGFISVPAAAAAAPTA